MFLDSTGPEVSGAVQDLLDSHPDGSCHGCIWQLVDDVPSPVLIIDRAEEIRAHLVEWAEGDPPSWFELEVKDFGTHYALALVPNLRRSRDRHLANMALASGAAVPAPTDYSMVFRTISFCSSAPSAGFASVRDRLGPKCPVFIVDRSEVDVEDPQACLPAARGLGDFVVVWDAPYISTLDKPSG